jgi:hypothetical protein
MAHVRLRSLLIGGAVLGLLALNVATAVLALSYQRLANKMLSAATALDDAAHPKKHALGHDNLSALGTRGRSARKTANAAPPPPALRLAPPPAPPYAPAAAPAPNAPPFKAAPFPGDPSAAPLWWSTSLVTSLQPVVARGRGVIGLSQHEFVVDRAVLDKTMHNSADLASSARIVPIPVAADGRASGFRLYGVRPDSLLAVLGIQNGDTIETINGWDVSSPDKALEAYSLLQRATELTVHILRDGRPVDLRYHVR